MGVLADEPGFRHATLTRLWVPPGGRRSICDIVQHVGGCKFLYHDQAFGDGLLAWEDPLIQGAGALATMPAAIEWLREGHARLRQSVATLDDGELRRLRPHHSGKPKETRWIITMMIQHDTYHAGEINYIRPPCTSKTMSSQIPNPKSQICNQAGAPAGF